MSLLRVFRFDEFDPDSKMDWLTILCRFALMTSLVVLPVVYVIMREVFQNPVLKALGILVASLYVPPLVLIRKPSVTVTPDFRVHLRNPPTVNSGKLLVSACSAVAYFVLAAVCTLLLGR